MPNPIVFNITVKLSENEAPGFVKALKYDILPYCTDGTIILASQVNKIHINDQEGDETFAIQFTYQSLEVFKDKKLETMSQFLDGLDEQFKGKYVYFATMMELLHLQK